MSQLNLKSVAILYICTGKYVQFWDDFFCSCEKNLLLHTVKHYYVFTDSHPVEHSECDRVHLIDQKQLGWPKDTLYRGHIFLKHWHQIQHHTYVFFMNANLLILNKVEEADLLPDQPDQFVACIHPGYFDKFPTDFTYDRNPQSCAYIPLGNGAHYFAGGLNGGSPTVVKKFITQMVEWIEFDESKNIVARWHDESYLNKFLLDYPYIKMLSPAFLYPEGWNLPFEQKISIRDKKLLGGHAKLRGETVFDRFLKWIRK